MRIGGGACSAVAATLIGSCLPMTTTDLVEAESSGATACEEAACACRDWYPDDDGDGFGDPARRVEVCGDPAPGLVANDEDCFDGNADARPGQLATFLTDRGDGNFDYDCDGVESLVPERKAHCQAWPSCGAGPIESTGWVGAFPSCGETGAWMDRCVYSWNTPMCQETVNPEADAYCR